jgi:RecB family endonuclease NucS
MGRCQRSIQNPEISEAHELVLDAVKNRYTATLVGFCEVTYKGRASSVLDGGDRLVVIKSDGSILVHQNRGRDPANYMYPGAMPSPTFKENGEVFRLKSKRRNPLEELVVDFSDVYQVSCIRLDDGKELDMYGQEEQMRDRVTDNPELFEDGFRVLEVEKRSDYGRIDIYGKDSEGTPVVIELKRNWVSPKDVDQLLRYVEDIENNGYEEVRGVFMAPELARQAGNRVRDRGLEFVKLDPKTEVSDENSSLDEFM